MIELYCGISDRFWNTVPVPDSAGPFMAGANNMARRIPANLPDVILDSGAFGDLKRLSPQAALDRQRKHQERNKYIARALVAYDWLIDEKWNDQGIRYKCRWDEMEAQVAVDTTIEANEFLALQDLNGQQKVHPLQGVTAEQQAYCADAVIPMVGEGDILGLGGWCIIGWVPPTTHKRKALSSTFWDSMWHIIPKAAEHGINHIHIFGVMVANILGGLRWLCDEYGIETVSTDSSGPSTNPAARGRWGYDDWIRKVHFPPGRERGEARIQHVQEVREWLADFRNGKHYRQPPYQNGKET